MKPSLLVATIAALHAAAAAADPPDLSAECDRVNQVHPLLILAVMAEGPMDCGEEGSGEFVDCDADSTPEERAARARRLAIRQYQEAAYERASDGCRAWSQERDSAALRQAAAEAIAAARASDRGVLPTDGDRPSH